MAELQREIERMSTRSTTHIHEMRELGGGIIVANFYRHSDGYPSGHGQDLADWLKGKRLSNGIGNDFVRGRDFNRAGTMAVHLMAHIAEVSGCESIPAEASKEEYEYHIYYDDQFYIECIETRSGKSIKTPADKYNGKQIEKLWWSDEE